MLIKTQLSYINLRHIFLSWAQSHPLQNWGFINKEELGHLLGRKLTVSCCLFVSHLFILPLQFLPILHNRSQSMFRHSF